MRKRLLPAAVAGGRIDGGRRRLTVHRGLRLEEAIRGPHVQQTARSRSSPARLGDGDVGAGEETGQVRRRHGDPAGNNQNPSPSCQATVNVYFHVVRASDGAGDVKQETVVPQIAEFNMRSPGTRARTRTTRDFRGSASWRATPDDERRVVRGGEPESGRPSASSR